MRRWRRNLAAVGLALVLVLTSAGCTSSRASTPPPSGTPSKAKQGQNMDAIAAGIQATLAQRPDVVKAEAKYADNFTSSGTIIINLTVKAGAALAPIEDEAVRLAWLSRLSPLHNIDIGIIDEVDKQRGENRTVAANGADKAALESKYGPRPK
jgi:hypothetical protein